MKSRTFLHILIMLLLIILIFTYPLWFASGDSIYPLPSRNAKTSNLSLPMPVREALKNVIAIRAEVHVKNNTSRFLRNRFRSGGTSYMVKPGIFISARHIIMVTISGLGYHFMVDRYGVPHSDIFDYSLYGTSDINNQSVDFPLTIAAMGDLSKFEDIMVLKASDYPAGLKILELDDRILNLDDAVYNSGYIPQYVEREDRTSEILFDVIKKGYPGIIDAVNTDIQINKAGVLVLYRIETKFERGFSGGPIFNSKGQVVGMTVLHNNNHLYAISTKDLKLFINRFEDNGIVPKR